MEPTLLAQLQALAENLSTEQDPNYKEEWERGYDSGMMAAGRLLKDVLAAAGKPAEEKAS